MSAQDIKMVKEFNQWRRGGDDVHADDKAYPKRLGDALDAVVSMAERADELEQERNRLNHCVSELEAAFDGVMQEAETRGRRIESLSSDVMRLRAAIQQTLDENGHIADGENCTLITLKRALDIQQCKKCGADMRQGIAMAQTFTGSPEFIGGEVCTVSPGGPGKLIECSKCPECGWSMTA